jgi:hypothetical protein
VLLVPPLLLPPLLVLLVLAPAPTSDPLTSHGPPVPEHVPEKAPPFTVAVHEPCAPVLVVPE